MNKVKDMLVLLLPTFCFCIFNILKFYSFEIKITSCSFYIFNHLLKFGLHHIFFHNVSIICLYNKSLFLCVGEFRFSGDTFCVSQST